MYLCKLNIFIIMKKLCRNLLSILLLLVASLSLSAQHTFLLSDTTSLSVNTDTAAVGFIYDNGGPSGHVTESSYQSISLYAPVGDTIRIWGSYSLDDNGYEYLRVYVSDFDTNFQGTGTFSIITTSGYLYIALSTISNSSANLALQYEVRPTSCASPIGRVSAHTTATTAFVDWDLRYYYLDSFHLYGSGIDTTVSYNECRLEGLARNTEYTLSLVGMLDDDADDCLHTITFKTVNCDDQINSIAVVDSGSTWLRLGWGSESMAGPYVVTFNGRDTTVSGSEILFEGLTPNTDYPVTVSSQADTCCQMCMKQIIAHTTCFKAGVSGIRPLMGNDAVVLTADSADSYLWSTGATTRSITVTEAGYYTLKVYTASGCEDTLRIGVSNVVLDIDLNIPSDICSGESYALKVGMGADANVRVNPNNIASMADPTRIFLPDGVDCDPTSDHGCSYRSTLEFNGFGNHELVTSANDIRYVMLNIEHSYIGDLYVNITCPNGQNADILKFYGSGSSSCTQNIADSHRGWTEGYNCSGCYLGQAYDNEDWNFPCDSTRENNLAGIGWRYCWSNSYDAGYTYAAGDARIYRYANVSTNPLTPSSFDSSNVALGSNFYHPDQSFASLIGCPMNGEWYIEVIDGWGSDNGYIFGWELALNPNRLMRNTYRASVASSNLAGDFFSRTNDTIFNINAPANLTHDTTVNYTVTIIDSLGNSFDTTFSITFHPTRVRYTTKTVVENALPVTYYGESFSTEVTNHPIVVANSDGCDSTIYLTLNIIPNTYATLDSVICASRLPFIWDGYTYTQSQTRGSIIPNSRGADSVITYQLTVLPWEPANVQGARSLIGDDDVITLVADPANSYSWSTGSTSNSISVNEPGDYTLVVNAETPCPDSTTVRIRRIHPNVDINIPETMCPGDSTEVMVGVTADANVLVSGVAATLSDGQRIFLPDGRNCDPSSDHGCSYRSELTFEGFSDNQLITSANDIKYVMLKIEHSFIGDLYMNITCPNGQNSDIMRFSGSGSSSCTGSIAAEHIGWQPGANTNSHYFGVPMDEEDGTSPCDSTSYSNRVGTGWRYCWSNNNNSGYTYAPGDGLCYRDVNHHLGRVDSSNVVMGTQFYHPDESFDSLIGCPMNGTWYIEVIDGWSSDNGYIFGWELSLNPELLANNMYSPNVTSADLVGPYQHRTTDTTFTIVSPTDLSSDSTVTYTVTIYDSIGISYDTTFTIRFLPSPRRTVDETVVENALPVVRYGRTFTHEEMGVEFTVPSDESCDSLITYNLHVIPNTYANRYDTICQNSLPYTWQGTTFATAGMQQVIIPNALGADSIISMYLYVNPNTASTYYDTCVENQLPRYFYGLTATNDVTGSTTTTTIPNANGCDSVITYNLKVWHNVTTTQDTAICDGGLPSFTWHGMRSSLEPVYGQGFKPTIHDTLSYFTSTTHGADSIVELRLTVKPTYHIDITANTCSNQPYSFEGNSYLESGVYTENLTTAGTPGCDSIRVLALTVFDTSRFDTTAVACDNFSWHGRHYAQSTDDVLLGQYTNMVGCDSTLMLHLTVNYSHTAVYEDTCVENQLPRTYLDLTATTDTTEATILTTTTLGCDSIVTYSLHVWRNQAITLDTLICDVDLADFEWNGQRSGLVPNDGTVIGTNNPVMYDTLFATIPTTHGADSAITMNVEIYPSYRFDYYDTICSNLSYAFQEQIFNTTGDYEFNIVTASGHCDSVIWLHLTVNPTYSHEQYDTIFISDSVVFEGSAYYTSGDYTVSYTTVDGCDSTYTLHLLAKPLHAKELFDSICEGDVYVFYGDSLRTAGVYLDTARALNRQDGDTVVTLTLAVLPRPTINLAIIDSSCSPVYYLLQGNASVPFIQWNSYPYDEYLDDHSSDSLLYVNPSDTTTYYFYADYSELGFCQQVDSIVVLPIDPVHAIIETHPNAITLEERNVVAYNRSTGHYTQHRWGVLYDGMASLIDTATKLQITVPNYADTACIWLAVNSRTCADTDTVCIPVMKSGLFIPNIFTPTINVNNRFKVVGLGVIDFEIWIYDRRGDIVYHSTDINEGWDGTKDGTDCPQASYVYKVKYSDVLVPNGYQNTTGTLTLIR